MSDPYLEDLDWAEGRNDPDSALGAVLFWLAVACFVVAGVLL